MHCALDHLGALAPHFQHAERPQAILRNAGKLLDNILERRRQLVSVVTCIHIGTCLVSHASGCQELRMTCKAGRISHHEKICALPGSKACMLLYMLCGDLT